MTKFKPQKDQEKKKRDKGSVIEKEKELKKKETTLTTVTLTIKGDSVNQMKKGYQKRVVEAEGRIKKKKLKTIKWVLTWTNT
jgi:hypothetical protein